MEKNENITFPTFKYESYCMIQTYDFSIHHSLWFIDNELFPYFLAYINSFFEIENLLFMFFDKCIICIRINVFVQFTNNGPLNMLLVLTSV